MDYTAQSGSTIITLLPAYLNTLQVGTYVISVHFNDNTFVTLEFTVAESQVFVNPFEDVFETDWFYDAVMQVYSNGLMTGTSTTPMLFSPDATLTRGMAVTVLHRLAMQYENEDMDEGSEDNDDVPNSSFPAPDFTDVAEGAYYYDAVAWAAANNIVVGYGDGRFGPEDEITREQMAMIIFNYAVYAGHGPQGAWAIHMDFADVADISDWAFSAAMYCYLRGIITGKPGHLFDPSAFSTRAEYATVMVRLLAIL